MKAKKDIIRTERSADGLTKISHNVEYLAKQLLSRHDFVEIDLLKNWKNIIGEDLAAYTLPERIDFPKDKKNDGTLVLNVSSGAFALEISHKSPIIIEKINTYFGYGAVSRLKIVQNAEIFTASQGTNIADIQKKKLVSPEQQNYIDDVGCGIENEELKAQLQSLAFFVSEKQKKEN